MLLQLGAFIWVFGQMQANIGHLQEDLQKLEATVIAGTQKRYDSDQATADKGMYLKLLDAINNRIEQSERRIERLENKSIND